MSKVDEIVTEHNRKIETVKNQLQLEFDDLAEECKFSSQHFRVKEEGADRRYVIFSGGGGGGRGGGAVFRKVFDCSSMIFGHFPTPLYFPPAFANLFALGVYLESVHC